MDDFSIILAMLLGTIRGTLRDPIIIMVLFGFLVIGMVSKRFVYFAIPMLVFSGLDLWLDSQVLWELGVKYDVVFALFNGSAALICAVVAYVIGRLITRTGLSQKTM